MAKEILVCIATESFPRDDYKDVKKFFYVNDGKQNVVSEIGADYTIEEFAKELHLGQLFLDPLVPEDRIVYEPFVGSEVILQGKYWGRVALPLAVYTFDVLTEEHKERFEKRLKELRKE
jgi:hypothetical protein